MVGALQGAACSETSSRVIRLSPAGCAWNDGKERTDQAKGRWENGEQGRPRRSSRVIGDGVGGLQSKASARRRVLLRRDRTRIASHGTALRTWTCLATRKPAERSRWKLGRLGDQD